MTISDTKKWVKEQLQDSYNSMQLFKNNPNPQVKELYIRSEVEYNMLNTLHYKLFKSYYKPAE